MIIHDILYEGNFVRCEESQTRYIAINGLKSDEQFEDAGNYGEVEKRPSAMICRKNQREWLAYAAHRKK